MPNPAWSCQQEVTEGRSRILLHRGIKERATMQQFGVESLLLHVKGLVSKDLAGGSQSMGGCWMKRQKDARASKRFHALKAWTGSM